MKKRTMKKRTMKKKKTKKKKIMKKKELTDVISGIYTLNQSITYSPVSKSLRI